MYRKDVALAAFSNCNPWATSTCRSIADFATSHKNPRITTKWKSHFLPNPNPNRWRCGWMAELLLHADLRSDSTIRTGGWFPRTGLRTRSNPAKTSLEPRTGQRLHWLHQLQIVRAKPLKTRHWVGTKKSNNLNSNYSMIAAFFHSPTKEQSNDVLKY